MGGQGGEAEWWNDLYGGSPDTAAPSEAPGSLEEWFSSASAVVRGRARRTPTLPDRPSPAGEPPGSGPPVSDKQTVPLPRVKPSRPAEPQPDPESESEPEVERVRVPGSAEAERGPEPEPEPAGPQDAPRRGGREPRDAGRSGVGPVAAGPRSGSRPEAGELAEVEAEELAAVVPEIALEAAGYGELTFCGASVRGEAARRDGLPRRDHLLLARFGEGAETLLVAIVGSAPDPLVPGSEAPADACRRLGAAIGHGRAELLADLREGAQERLRFGLQRLTTAAARHLPPPADVPPGTAPAVPAGLHALLMPGDPEIRPRVGFGVGPGGYLLLDGDEWFDAYAGVRLTDSARAPEPSGFRFRVAAPEAGDVLLLCSGGFAEPVRGEPAVSGYLAERWSGAGGRRGRGVRPPGVEEFLRHVRVPARGHDRDRSALAVWEA